MQCKQKICIVLSLIACITYVRAALQKQHRKLVVSVRGNMMKVIARFELATLRNATAIRRHGGLILLERNQRSAQNQLL